MGAQDLVVAKRMPVVGRCREDLSTLKFSQDPPASARTQELIAQIFSEHSKRARQDQEFLQLGRERFEDIACEVVAQKPVIGAETLENTSTISRRSAPGR